MAKPQIIVNAGDPGVKAAVSASTSWTATLDSTDGVRQVEWAVTSTDETTTAASYTLVTSGSVGQTVTSTSQGQGTALILWVRVNAGKVGDQPDPENTEATVKIYVPLADGGEVGCAGEEYESDPTFGSTGIINSGIRKAAALSPSGVPVKIVRAATSTALPANTRTNNILTASSNGAIGTVGGVAVVDGDHILVKDEGGVAAHVNDGPYVLADGDGSSPWTLTRATYFDASEELIPMTTFRIQEGTYAGKEFYLATSGATINVTALEFAAYAYAPNDAAYLCVGSSGFLSNEVNVSAIGTTVEFTSTSTVPFATKRTDSATAALVDVEQVTALSSGTAAAGFGPSTLYKGEVFGGGAENYGRIGFAATDLTNTSEDTKLVVQARTAGASLATCAEFSGTAVKLTALGGSGSGVVAVANDGTLSFSAGGGADASAKYLTDAASTVNANDVPTQSMTGTLNFFSSANPLKVGRSGVASSDLEAFRVRRTVTDNSGNSTGNTAAHIAFEIPNGSGTATDVANIKVQIASTIGPSANIIFRPMGSGTMADALTVKGGGIIQFNGLDYQHDGYRLVLDASGNLSASVVSFDEVKTALAAATSAVTIDDDLIVSGDLTVSGTTTTVDSTTVSLADRLIVLNSSTGTVPVPVDIAGFVIDRGSADGVTKRDMPGLFWDETNTRFDLAYNTAGDQSTIGSFVGLKLSALTVSSLGSGIAHLSASGVMSSSAIVNADVDAAAAIAGTKISPDFGAQNITTTGSSTAGSSGFVGPQIDRATLGTFAFGSNINAVTFTAALSGITTLAASDTATITKTALGTTSAAGIYLVNTTSGAGNQYTPGLRMSSFSGATQKQAAIEHRALGTSRSQIIVLYGSGSTYPTSTLALFDESDSTFFDVRTRSNGFVSVQSTAGYLFTSGTGLYSSGSNDLECRSTASSAPLLLKGNKSTGGTGAAVTSRAYSGTQTAGYLHNFESGSTQMAGVAYDGTWEGPVLRNTSTKSSNYSAALYDLVEYSVGGGTFTVTLPNPAAGTQGRFIVTKNIGSSGTPLSVATGTGYIDNAATIQVAGGYASDTFVADNANGYLRIAAIRPWNITATKTADYTTAIGEVVKCDPSGAGFNVDLPAMPSTATLRDVDVIVKNITSSTNTITIRPQAGQTIDGAANVTITTARGVVRLLAIPGGTDWMII